MAINLGGNTGMNNPAAGQMDILNLQKNDVLDLTKREPGLTKVTLGAGWDVAQSGQDFDLDISALLLDQNGKVTSALNQVVFFNNPSVPGVMSTGDNRTGAGDGDDEQILIDLTQVSPLMHRIVFVVTIHEAMQRRQTFGMVQNSYVRLLNTAQGEREICRFSLKEDGAAATAIIFAELQRQGSEWQFKAVGEGKTADLNGVLRLYM